MDKNELVAAIREARSAALVVNTRSRKGARLFTQAMNALEQRGMAVPECHGVNDPRMLRQVVREMIDHGHRLIVVGGGDGTISAVVDEFAYRDVVLGILPLGTENSAARTLGIPSSLQGALEIIISGKVAEVDLGKIGDDYFINVVAAGISADAVRTTSGTLKRYLGRLAYLIRGASVLFRHQPFRCRFSTAGRELTFRTHEVIIENGRYFGEILLSPEASPSSHQLTVCTMKEASHWKVFKRWIVFLLGRRPASESLRCFNTRDVWLETDPPQVLDVDGEALLQSPVHLTIEPDALRVMVSQAYEER